MKHTNRFTPDLIAIGIIIVMVVLSFALVWMAQSDLTRKRGSAFNQGDEGTAVFFNWLSQQNSDVRTVESLYSLANSSAKTVFILNAQGSYAQDELVMLDAWIRGGGTAVIALESNLAKDLTRHFNLGISWTWPGINNAELQLPLLNWPIVNQTSLKASHKIDIRCGRAAVHIGTCRRPVLVSFGHGQGQIYFLSTVEPFTNQGISNGGNAQLIENLVQNSTAKNGPILFDEGHRQSGFFWFLTSPAGWALILLFLLLIALFAWQAFNTTPNKPAPVMAEPVSEVQESIQYLNRVAAAEKNIRGAKAVKQHYWQRLKRILGQRYGLDPTMADEQFLAAIKTYLPETDMALLISLRIRKDRDQMLDTIALRTWAESVIQLTEKYQVVTRERYLT